MSPLPLMFGLHPGDFNPFRTAPMLGTHEITGPNAGGPRQFPIPTPLAARAGQFWRWAAFALVHP